VSDRFGVLLMTYGSPASLADVDRYVRAVRGGRDVAPDVVAEMRRRYELIGGSPLVDITHRQAAALERRLGGRALVRAAMRFSDPSIEDALDQLAGDGVTEAVGVILSPQYSPLLMDGYRRDVEVARGKIGDDAPVVRMAGAWYGKPAFTAALAGRVRDGLAHLSSVGAAGVAVLMTAHSLPRRVADEEPDYIAQLQETAMSVAARAELSPDLWTFCWQSAGHTPEEWLKPDFADLMPDLAAAGRQAVLVVPVQFLADHLEVLYDIDVGARAQAEQFGLRFERIRSLNDDAQLIEILAEVVLEEVALVAAVSTSRPSRQPSGRA
jgi:ferrochelatase